MLRGSSLKPPSSGGGIGYDQRFTKYLKGSSGQSRQSDRYYIPSRVKTPARTTTNLPTAEFQNRNS